MTIIYLPEQFPASQTAHHSSDLGGIFFNRPTPSFIQRLPKHRPVMTGTNASNLLTVFSRVSLPLVHLILFLTFPLKYIQLHFLVHHDVIFFVSFNTH
jgi:hypothetical protein